MHSSSNDTQPNVSKSEMTPATVASSVPPPTLYDRKTRNQASQ